MSDPFFPVQALERAVADYTGAPYVVAVNSCTMALLLAVKWNLDRGMVVFGKQKTSNEIGDYVMDEKRRGFIHPRSEIEIPARTYISVPMSIIHAGARPAFRDETWSGAYCLQPLPVFDCARRFTSGMYRIGEFQCVSFHQSKILGDSQGGAILHGNPEADVWLRKARFDGRTEGVAPARDTFTTIGWHCYLSPDVAARLLWKLTRLPAKNADLLNDPYPDLSQMEIFK